MPPIQDVIGAVHLSSQNKDVIHDSLRLLQKAFAHDTLPLLPSVVQNLGHNDSLVSRGAMNCVALYAKAEPLSVIEQIRKGLQSSDAALKRQCLRAVNVLKNEVDDEVLAEVMEHLKDPDINQTAVNTARILLKESPRIGQKVPEGYQMSIERTEKAIVMLKNKEIQDTIPDHISDEVRMKLGNSNEKQVKLEILQSLMQNQGDLQQTLNFLRTCLSDSNRTVIVESLKLLNKLLSEIGSTRQANFTETLKLTFRKLGEDRIQIRQLAYQACLKFLREYGGDQFLPKVIRRFDSASWHEREEALNIIIYSLLAKNIQIYFNYLEIVPNIGRLLNDPRSKVRFVASEAICAVADRCGAENVLDRLLPCIDEVAAAKVKERLKKRILPSVKQDGSIELPRIIPSSAPTITNDRGFFNGSEFTNRRFTRELTTRLKDLDGSANLTSPRRRTRARVTTQLNNEIEPIPVIQPKVIEEIKERLQVEAEQPKTLPPIKSPVKIQPETNYLQAKDISEVNNPERAIEKCMTQPAEEWSEQFEVINLLRRLLKHHGEAFQRHSAHEISLRVVKWADSLRSSLCKNALIVLGEMFQYVPRLIEPELEQITALLLRKSADTNTFISEEAQKSLVYMTQFAHEGKLAGILFQSIQNSRSGAIRSKIALAFQEVSFIQLLKRMGINFRNLKEFKRIIQALSGLIFEASFEVRNEAKTFFHQMNSILQVISSGPEAERIYRKLLPSNQFQQLADALKKSEIESPLKKLPKSADFSVKKVQTHRRVQGVKDPIVQVSLSFDSQDPQQRAKGLAELKQIAEKQQKISPIAIDSLRKAVQDQENNIVLQGLTTIIQLSSIEGNLNTLLVPVIECVNNSNAVISDTARDTFRAIVVSIGANKAITQLTNVKVQGKAWRFLLQIITELVPRIHADRPSLLNRYLIPFIKQIAGDKDAVRLIERTQQVMGDNWLDT